MKSYVNDLFKKCLSLSSYDPNYIYEDQDDAMNNDDGDEGWGSDFEDDNQDAE